jgi:hypothetical protein
MARRGVANIGLTRLRAVCAPHFYSIQANCRQLLPGAPLGRSERIIEKPSRSQS